MQLWFCFSDMISSQSTGFSSPGFNGFGKKKSVMVSSATAWVGPMRKVTKPMSPQWPVEGMQSVRMMRLSL